MILDDIIFNKRQEVTSLKIELNHHDLKKLLKNLPKPRRFLDIFEKGKVCLIAECKKASPSAGVIMGKYQPAQIAKLYEKNGAAAISVLTDKKFFRGNNEHLKAVKATVKLPILRKDFIIDEAQVYESRIIGADAILLIARVLNAHDLKTFIKLAEDLGMQALVEVHEAREVKKALRAGAKIIGINNRDLSTFKVDINQTLNLIKKYPELKRKFVVSESGIKTKEDITALQEAKVAGVLIGESLMKAKDINAKVRELFC